MVVPLLSSSPSPLTESRSRLTSSLSEPDLIHPTIRFQLDATLGVPSCTSLDATFADFYQLSMMYAYWKSDKHNSKAVFDLYFRKCPFKGEFAVFAGLQEALKFVNTLKFTEEQIQYIRAQLPPTVEKEFFEYMETVDGRCITIYSVREGNLVFPRVPLLRVEGPLAVCQLIETALINCTSFATLVATNAARFRLAAGWNKWMIEFGARRAQGPNGAISASRYAYVGGFDGTSNTKAGLVFGIPISGTHAHAFVTSFRDLSCLSLQKSKVSSNFLKTVLEKKKLFIEACSSPSRELLMKEGELAAFVAYAEAFPESFICLVDTYDTLSSGIPNFICVALALIHYGKEPQGIRLDSGDLAYLSKAARALFANVEEKLGVDFSKVRIIASNEISEAVLMALKEQENEIDAFGIGTQLATCQAQPALGMVYKLSELDGKPCMKLSQEMEKTSIPSRKSVYRLYSKTNQPCLDLVQGYDDAPPVVGERIFCRHLFDDTKRCYVVPTEVEELLELVWYDGRKRSQVQSLQSAREQCMSQLRRFRGDHLRPVNPTPYKVSASEDFFNFFHKMWQQTAPVFTIE